MAGVLGLDDTQTWFLEFEGELGAMEYTGSVGAIWQVCHHNPKFISGFRLWPRTTTEEKRHENKRNAR